ncbi:hypothetical protein [Bacillus cereus group sp. BfR-BA-01382]|uniref:hypothetical protein n=1 Tax=Bacillus cereus group sp. BfR-BA-01382 TaxID=2920326 RepID=UPI001F58AE34
MNNIIKRRHTNQYAQIHNNPLQNDLVDLRAIGLLSHLMSLPSDWIIYKTQLYKKFSRKNIDAAWKELANKNYIIGFNCYIDGKKKAFYNVSDIPFVSDELYTFIRDNILELIHSGFSVKSLSLMNGGNLEITKDITTVLKVHQSVSPKKTSTAPSVQYSQYSTQSTYTKKIDTKKIITKIDDEDILNVCHSNINNMQNLKNDNKINTEQTVQLSDNDILGITNKVWDIFKDKIQKRSFDSVLKKCINNYKKGTVPNYENYLITSIENKIIDLEHRSKREQVAYKIKTNKRREIIPEWLQLQKQEELDNVAIETEDIEVQRERLNRVLQKYQSNK